MVLTATVAGICIFCLGYHVSVLTAIIYCVPTAFAGAYTELVSKNGVDTFTVPCVNVVCLLMLAMVV